MSDRIEDVEKRPASPSSVSLPSQVASTATWAGDSKGNRLEAPTQSAQVSRHGYERSAMVIPSLTGVVLGRVVLDAELNVSGFKVSMRFQPDFTFPPRRYAR